KNAAHPSGVAQLFIDALASRHRLDARGKTRHATRGGILGDDALGCAALDLRLSRAQRRGGGLLVARLDRLLDLLDRGAHAAAARVVRRRAALGLARALLGEFVTSH